MSKLVLLCTDGSELAIDSLRRGLAVLAPSDRVVVVSVIELTSPMEVIGTGLAGGVVSPQQAERDDEAMRAMGDELVRRTAAELGLVDVEVLVVDGPPGPALVDVATQLDASVLVIGTRGRGGLRRAVLGSVSDHVVRNAPCPVVVVSAEE